MSLKTLTQNFAINHDILDLTYPMVIMYDNFHSNL